MKFESGAMDLWDYRHLQNFPSNLVKHEVFEQF